MKTLGMVTILRNDRVTFHSYLSPEDGEMVCSQVIETEDKVVIVDALLLRPHAEELRRYVDRLNKPIDRVIVTHSHPDHWFGLEFFQDVPIYSLPETRDEIAQVGDYLLQYKGATLGDLVADNKVVPTNIVQEGTEVIDGLRYVFTKVVDTEAPIILLVELPDLNTLVAQDLVYNHVYLCVGEQNSKGEYLFDGWKNYLKKLQGEGYETVLSGHGEPTNSSIFPEIIGYIEYAQQIFEAGSSEVEQKQKLMDKYPTYRVSEVLDISNVFLFHRDW